MNVVVTSAPFANFSYSNTSYCSNGTNPLPNFSVGASAGVFSATPAGLVFVNTATGEINLAASTPGTYTVTFTLPGLWAAFTAFSGFRSGAPKGAAEISNTSPSWVFTLSAIESVAVPK